MCLVLASPTQQPWSQKKNEASPMPDRDDVRTVCQSVAHRECHGEAVPCRGGGGVAD